MDHFDDSVLRDCYSQSKALATQAVLDAVRERGLNACVVHPSGIMGPEDFAVGETTSTMIKIINGEMIKPPLQCFYSTLLWRFS